MKNCSAGARLAALALLAIPAAARAAADVGLKVEPALALPLSARQSQPFSVDGSGALKGFIGLAPWADAAATVVMLGLPTMAGSLSPESARAWGGGGGLMLRLPLSGTHPWLDGDALFVRTGAPGHFAFAAGGGLSFPLGEKRSFWLGPFVRYLQIVRYDSGGDSKSLIVGLSLEATASFSAAR